MKALLPILASCLLLTACVGVSHLHSEPDSSGVYRAVDRSNERVHPGMAAAVREDDGRLAATAKRADELIQRRGSLVGLQAHMESSICWAERMYEADQAQKLAVIAIKQKDFAGVRAKLDEARKACATITYSTLQAYLEGVVALARGDLLAARGSATEFLEWAAATEHSFYSAELTRELAFYRQAARDFQTGVSAELPLAARTLDETVAKMYENSLGRPGGNTQAGYSIQPFFGFSSLSGYVIGLGVYRSWGTYSLLPSFAFSESLGGIYGLQLRRSLYESPDRGLNLDAILLGESWREATVVHDGLGERRLVNQHEGFNYGGGFGVTQRFLYPSLGLSAQGLLEQNTYYQELKAYGTLFGFYDLTQGVSVFAGVVRNSSTLGIAFNFVQLGYSFRDQGLRVDIMGLRF